MLTLGSLFDGSGTCPLAATMCGVTPVWASEIEPFPVAVTSSRFPEMKHLGDITQINGAEIPFVDIITFGSPCQNLSIAGNRKGLEGEESSLFLEAVRIIKEMKEASNGEYPQLVMWENVPGAFSSNGGEISRRSSKASAKSATQTYLYLNRKSGAEQDSSWETITVSDGGSSMLQVGESPKEESVSLLSWILEDNVPDKYFLSEKACRGILRRSSEKGKPLPELLTIALENTIALMRWKTTPMTAEFDWSQITLFRPSTKEWEPGGGNVPLIVSGFKHNNSGEAYSLGYEEQKAPSLTADGKQAAVVPYCRAGGALNAEETDGSVSPCLLARAGTGGGNVPTIVLGIKGGGAAYAR